MILSFFYAKFDHLLTLIVGMKFSTFFRFLSLIFISALITSCAVTEEIWVEKQGSGRYELTMEMGGMMGFLSMMDTVERDEPLMSEVIDSSFTFASMFEDNDTIDLSILSRPELLDKVKLGMKMDQENEIMDISIIIDFDSFEEADEIMREVAKLQALKEGEESSANPASPESVLGMLDEEGLGISWSKGRLIREQQEMDAEDMKEFGEMEEGEMQMVKSMLNGMDFTTIVHLPGKVKQVSDPEGVIIDKNTVQFTYSLSDIMKSGKYGGFEIKYK